MIALANIVCGGVVEDFPSLRVRLPGSRLRLGGVLGGAARRALRAPLARDAEDDEGAVASTSPTATCSCRPSPTSGWSRWSPSSSATDCVFYASDYPHTDSKFPYSVKCVKERDDLPDGLLPKLLGAQRRPLLRHRPRSSRRSVDRRRVSRATAVAMRVRQLSPALGAEVTGIDLRAPIDAATMAELTSHSTGTACSCFPNSISTRSARKPSRRTGARRWWCRTCSRTRCPAARRCCA